MGFQRFFRRFFFRRVVPQRTGPQRRKTALGSRGQGGGQKRPGLHSSGLGQHRLGLRHPGLVRKAQGKAMAFLVNLMSWFPHDFHVISVWFPYVHYMFRICFSWIKLWIRFKTPDTMPMYAYVIKEKSVFVKHLLIILLQKRINYIPKTSDQLIIMGMTLCLYVQWLHTSDICEIIVQLLFSRKSSKTWCDHSETLSSGGSDDSLEIGNAIHWYGNGNVVGQPYGVEWLKRNWISFDQNQIPGVTVPMTSMTYDYSAFLLQIPPTV